ncbi:SLC18B1 [Bugula neritina]|uniref:SLC18B1 n=1 Tax=Bugula neritina TaxID=10212 RepID=A0A7J7KMN2_BUGNE|nr:SLC18B1 [Bugula neritina]
MASEKTPLLNGVENGEPPQTDAQIQNISKDVAETETKAGWTKQQILTAVTLSLMNISQTISFSILAPFYPSEAAKKGASSAEVGLVFGVFQLIIFITSPIYGNFIQQIGAKSMFLSGSFILGGCSIAFGFLDKCPDGPVYVAMCFVSRSIEANGCAMLGTASFAIMASTFRKNVGQALGTLEIFSGLGMVLGPSIGGALYTAGGYLLPFLVIGGIVWATTLLSFFILPPITDMPKMSGNIFSLLRIPGCIIVYLVIAGSGMYLSFLDPTFSPWIQKTFPWMTVGTIGLFFMILPAVYALSAPFSGYVSDKGYQGSMSVAGLFLTGISYFLLGPSPWLSWLIPTTLPLTAVALILLGISIGAALIPVFPLVIRLAKSRGFEDNLQTYGLMAGMFQSGFCLGGFVGPSAAGYFTGQFGFEWATSVCGFISIFLACLMLTYILIMKSKGQWPVPIPEEQQDEEKTTPSSVESPAQIN